MCDSAILTPPLVGIWDARDKFVDNKFKGNNFAPDDLSSVSRLGSELQFGDLVMVYYSVSSFAATPAYQTNPPIVLSFNLYGVVLLANAPADFANN